MARIQPKLIDPADASQRRLWTNWAMCQLDSCCAAATAMRCNLAIARRSTSISSPQPNSIRHDLTAENRILLAIDRLRIVDTTCVVDRNATGTGSFFGHCRSIDCIDKLPTTSPTMTSCNRRSLDRCCWPA